MMSTLPALISDGAATEFRVLPPPTQFSILIQLWTVVRAANDSESMLGKIVRFPAVSRDGKLTAVWFAMSNVPPIDARDGNEELANVVPERLRSPPTLDRAAIVS